MKLNQQPPLYVVLILCLVHASASLSVEEEHQTTEAPPPKPYAFGYAAGRFPGHIDRTHSEVSDGSGTVQGSYSYVDPRHKVRTVDYIADKQGFHVISPADAPPLPSDTQAVAQAKNRHLVQYANIALAHQLPGNVVVPLDSVAVSRAKDKHFTLYQKIAEEHARIAAQLEQEKLENEGTAKSILLE